MAHLNFGRFGCHFLNDGPLSHKVWKEDIVTLIYYFLLSIGCVAGTEMFRVGGDWGEGKGWAQGGDNDGIQWGGTETSGYGYYVFFKYISLPFRCVRIAVPLVAFNLRNPFIVRWVWGKWGRDWRARDFHPRAGWVWLGPHLDGGECAPALAESKAQRLLDLSDPFLFYSV